jgi:hypothetical protein
MTEGYWRTVLKGAWKKSVPAGWNRQKFAALAIPIIGALVVGGWSGAWNVLPLTIGGVIGAACVAPILFIWGVFETQCEMYHELEAARATSTDEVASQSQEFPKTSPDEPSEQHDNPEKVDFEMYRHLQQMPLRTAAQLWAGQVPGMRIHGQAKQTYAMLCGGIQSGDLQFAGGALPGMNAANLKYYKLQPHPELIVTRGALKEFAGKHNYNPRFLRNG